MANNKNLVGNNSLIEFKLAFLTRDAKRALDDIQLQIDLITNALKNKIGFTPELVLAQKEAETLKTILALTTDFKTGLFDVLKFNSLLNESNLTIGLVQHSLNSLGVEGSKAWSTLATLIASALIPMKRTSVALNEIGTFFTNSLRWSATSGIIHGVTNEISKAFSYALNLDKSLTNILMVTGHSSNYMKDFAREANEAAKSLSASTLEYTNAALIYYQLGLTDKEVAERTAITVKMAHVTGESVKDVANLMTSIWNNFSTGIDNLERYSDVVTKLGATTAASSKEVASGLSKFSSIANTVGLSYDYAASAVATVTATTRQSADSIGTSFKTLFSRLESIGLGETLEDGVNLTKYSLALMKVGVSVLDTNGLLKDMDSILNDLGNKWNSIGKAQLVALALTVGGVRNYTTMVSLMEHWDEFLQNVTTAQTSKGSLLAQASIYEKSWEASLNRVQAVAQTNYQNLISSDFFKGLNNATAKTLNALGAYGQKTGTGGTAGTLANLGLGLFKDRIATGIDNLVNNFMGETRSGIAIAAQQLADMIKEMTATSISDSTFDLYKGSNGSPGLRELILGKIQEKNNEILEKITDKNVSKSDLKAQLTALGLASSLALDLFTQMAITEHSLGEVSVAAEEMAGIFADRNVAGIGGITTSASMGREYIYGGLVAGSVERIAGEMQRIAAEALRTGDFKLAESEMLALLQSVSGEGNIFAKEGFVNSSMARSAAASLNKTIEEYQKGFRAAQKDPNAINLAWYDEKAKYRSEAVSSTSGNIQANMTLLKESKRLTDGLFKELKSRVSKAQETGLYAALNSIRANQLLNGLGESAGWETQDDLVKEMTSFGSIVRYKTDKEGKLLASTYYQASASFGNFAINAAMAANALTAMNGSLDNLILKTAEGKSEFSDWATALANTGMTIGMTANLLNKNGVFSGGLAKSLGAFFGTGVDGKGAKLGSMFLTGETGAITAAGAATLIGGAVVIAETIALLESYAENQTTEAKLERANELAILSLSEAKEDLKKFNAFTDAIKSHNLAVNKAQTLVKGSASYTSAMLAANEQALTIIDVYNLLAGKDYTTDNNGLIQFSNILAEAIYANAETEALRSAIESLLNTSRTNLLLYQRNIEYYEEQIHDITSKYTQNYANAYRFYNPLSGLYEVYNDDGTLRAASTDATEFLLLAIASGLEYMSILELTPEDQKTIDEYRAKIETEKQYSFADYLATLNSYAANNSNLTDLEKLAIRALGAIDSEENLKAYTDEALLGHDILAIAGMGWWINPEDDALYSNLTGNLLTEDNIKATYKKVFDRLPDETMTKELMAADILAYWLENAIINPAQQLAEEYGFNNLSSTTIAQLNKAENLNLKDFKSLTEAIFKETGSIEAIKALIGPAILALTNAFEDLAKTVTTNDQIAAASFAELLSTETFSATQLQAINAYSSTLGATIGEYTGAEVFKGLSTLNDNTKGFNQDFLKELNKLDLTNGITAYFSYKEQEKIAALNNKALSQSMQDLGKALKKDIDERGGTTRSLFIDENFSKIYSSLATAAVEGNRITTADIAKLATKNATLNAYLNGTAEDGVKSYQSIIDIGEMLATGLITTGDITDNFARVVAGAGGVQDFLQAGVDTVNELNLGTSYSEVDEYWQNIGKAWATATKADMAHDAPFYNAMRDILSEEQFTQFSNLMQDAFYKDLSTSDVNKLLKTEMKPVYDLLTGTAGFGKYFGKGSGGVETAIAYFGTMYGDQLANNYGIVFDPKTGDIRFNDLFQENYNDKMGTDEVTSEGMYEYLTKAFSEFGNYSDKLIETFAKLITGWLGSTDAGYVLDIGNAALSLNELIKSFNDLGYASAALLDAIYNLFDPSVLSNLIYDEVDHVIRSKTKEERADPNKGSLTLELVLDLIDKGVPILGKAAESFSNLANMGRRLAGLSRGTIGGIKNEKEAANLNDDEARLLLFETLNNVVTTYTGYRNASTGTAGNINLGQFYDYDDLMSFFTENQGYSTEEAKKAIREIIDNNKQVVRQYTDAYGRTYSIDSSLYENSIDYLYAIDNEDRFGRGALEEKLLEKASDDLMEKYYNSDTGEFDYENYYKEMQNRAAAIKESFDEAEEKRNGNLFIENGQKPDTQGNGNPDQGNGNPDQGNGNPDQGNEQTPGPSSSNITSSNGLTLSDINSMIGHGYAWQGDTIYYHGPNGETFTNHDLLLALNEIDNKRKGVEAYQDELDTLRIAQLAIQNAKAYSEDENYIRDFKAAQAQEQENRESEALNTIGDANIRSEYNDWLANHENGTPIEFLESEEGKNALNKATSKPELSTGTITGPTSDMTPLQEEAQSYSPGLSIYDTSNDLAQNMMDSIMVGEQSVDDAARTLTAMSRGEGAETSLELLLLAREAIEQLNNWNNAQTGNIEESTYAEPNALARETAKDAFDSLSERTLTAIREGKETVEGANGEEISIDEAAELLKVLNKIANNTSDAVDLLQQLNDVVGEGGGEALTGESSSELQYNENDNLINENDNSIDLGLLDKSVTQTATGTGGGSTANPEGPLPNDSKDLQGAADAFHNAINNGTLGAGEGFLYNGLYYILNDDGSASPAPTGTIPPANTVDLSPAEPTEETAASGKNNNLLPLFASGTGTIAVTGELGPELHIKSDGSMDLLGKHGREYAWVEPNDRIYTAALTASILGSKKIRDMIGGFANGINNFIPLFGAGDWEGAGTQLGSSTGGGSGGSLGRPIDLGPAELTAENHRYDVNWIKYRDVLERYYTILQLMENIANSLERFANLADRAWGRERIDNIERVIKTQEELVIAQRQYLSEIKTYLNTDKDVLTNMIKEFVDDWNTMYPNEPLTFSGAQFDSNGVLTNYKELVSTMVDAYNRTASGYTYTKGLYSVGAAGTPGTGIYGTMEDTTNLRSRINLYRASGLNNNIFNYASGLELTSSINDLLTSMGINISNTSTSNSSNSSGTIQDVTDKIQEGDMLTKLEESLKDIQFYTETLNLYEQLLTVLELLEQLLFDTRLQAIQIEVEYKVSLKNNAFTLLEYELAKVKDDAYMAAEAVSLIGLEQDINIEILKDYEQLLKDIFNTNLNGERFFGGEDWTLTPTMDLSLLLQDLMDLEEFHSWFWDEESLSYVDKIKENLENGEIALIKDTEEESEDMISRISGNTLNNWFKNWDQSGTFSNYLNELRNNFPEGLFSWLDESTEENTREHSIDEYNALVAKLYEKYYANYSQYLPDPELFLKYTNDLKRLEYEKKYKQDDEEDVFASLFEDISIPSLLGGEESDTSKDYLFLIENAEDAYNRLAKLSELLNGKTIHADINKFTSEWENMGEVSEKLQNIFDGLLVGMENTTDGVPKLVAEILKLNNELVIENEETGKWLLNILSYKDAEDILEKINKANRQRMTDEKFNEFMSNPTAFWDWMTDLSENYDFTNFTANEILSLNQLATTYLSSISDLKNKTLTQIDYLGNSVKSYAKDMDTVFNKFDNFKNLYSDWLNIIDLTGRAVTKLSHDLIVELNAKVVDNSINKLKSAKAQFDSLATMLANALILFNNAKDNLDNYAGENEDERYWLLNIVDEYRTNLDKINKETEEAHDTYMKSWEDALQGLSQAFQKAVADASAGFEENFSPVYSTFEALSAALSRERELQDLYLLPYQLLHDLSKLSRDIKNSILDTDNLNSKRELKKLLEDINKVQEDGVELSAYDLDTIQKKYDLELARQALEDAKNAKSLVRLARDNNGNWSYVYTANEDDVDEAELRYEDAILAMEQANEEYIRNLLDLLLSVWSNAEQLIAALNPAEFATEADYQARVDEIVNVANKEIGFILSLMENALNNNQYLLDNVSGKARDIIKDLTTAFDNTTLASLTGNNSISNLATLSIDNVNNLADLAIEAYHKFWTLTSSIWDTAGYDLSDASTVISGATNIIAEASTLNVDEMTDAITRADEAFSKLNSTLEENMRDIYLIVSHYELITKALNTIIELSGEYIKLNTLTIDTNIHDWTLLDEIYAALATQGAVWVKWLDENNEELLKYFEAGSEDTIAWLSGQREYLADLLKHASAEQVLFSSLALLEEYFGNIEDQVKKQGLLKLDIKGNLLAAILKEELPEDAEEGTKLLREYFDNYSNLIDEEGNLIEDGDDFGLLTINYAEEKEKAEKLLEMLKKILEVKRVIAAIGGGGGGDPGVTSYWTDGTTQYFPDGSSQPIGGNVQPYQWGGLSYTPPSGDTGLYTGRWQSMDTGGYTGMYTGEWPGGSVRRNGRLAWLHLKELVLNAHDTENFLDAMEIVRLLDNLTNWMANGLGILMPSAVESSNETLQQEVTIHAEFPNAVNHSEIELAFENIVNLASLYANRK